MSSIWTEQDQTDVKAAIMSLATGARSVTLANGQVITKENLPALRELLAEIQSALRLDAAAGSAGGFVNKVVFDGVR